MCDKFKAGDEVQYRGLVDNVKRVIVGRKSTDNFGATYIYARYDRTTGKFLNTEEAPEKNLTFVCGRAIQVESKCAECKHDFEKKKHFEYAKLFSNKQYRILGAGRTYISSLILDDKANADVAIEFITDALNVAYEKAQC